MTKYNKNMKRIITILIYLMFVLNASAQWRVLPLKDNSNKNSIAYIYQDKYDYFCCSENSKLIRIGTNNGEFLNNVNNKTFKKTSVYIILYNENKAVKRYCLDFNLIDNNDFANSATYENRKVYKILNHLKNDGDIRILADKSINEDFNILIKQNDTISFKHK